MNILITSVGRRSYLVQYFKNALKTDGQVYVCNNVMTPAFQAADGGTVSPDIYDKHYISFILDYCRKYKVSLVISCFDIDLPVLAQYKEDFKKEGIILIVSEPSVLNICNDKWKMYQYLCSKNISTPKTWLNSNEAIESMKKGEIESLFIKPRWGMGSLGIFHTSRVEEVHLLSRISSRHIKNSYLKYEASQEWGKSIIYQESIQGQEYGMDVVNDLDKVYRTTWMRKKLAMRAGETDSAEVVDLPDLRLLATKLSKVGHIGNLDVDVIEHNNEFYVIDMNARFGGGYPFSHLAGANLPLALLSWAQGKEPEENWEEISIGTVGYKEILPKIL